MRYLWIIVWAVLSLLLRAECRGQSVLNQKILGQGAYSRDFIDVFSSGHNQASLVGIKSFSAGILIQQRFSMKELRSISLSLALPVREGVFNLQAETEGVQLFKRQEWSLGYARQLFEWMDVGAEVNYFRMQIPTYGEAAALTFSLSVLCHVEEKWHLGMQVFNPQKAHYGKLGDDPIPAIFQLGVGFQATKNFLITTEGRFSGKEKSLLLGFRYKLVDELSVSAGVSTGVYPVYAGVCLYLKQIKILITADYHEQLGLSPGAGIIYTNHPGYE